MFTLQVFHLFFKLTQQFCLNFIRLLHVCYLENKNNYVFCNFKPRRNQKFMEEWYDKPLSPYSACYSTPPFLCYVAFQSLVLYEQIFFCNFEKVIWIIKNWKNYQKKENTWFLKLCSESSFILISHFLFFNLIFKLS